MPGSPLTQNIWQARLESALPNGHSSPGARLQIPYLTRAPTIEGCARWRSSKLHWHSRDETFLPLRWTFLCRFGRAVPQKLLRKKGGRMPNGKGASARPALKSSQGFGSSCVNRLRSSRQFLSELVWLCLADPTEFIGGVNGCPSWDRTGAGDLAFIG